MLTELSELQTRLTAKTSRLMENEDHTVKHAAMQVDRKDFEDGTDYKELD